jgi:hypothetical protein
VPFGGRKVQFFAACHIQPVRALPFKGRSKFRDGSGLRTIIITITIIVIIIQIIIFNLKKNNITTLVHITISIAKGKIGGDF